jgi:hypothetical protein
MQPMSRLEKKYPKLAKWIVGELPKVKNKGKVWTAFVKYSELSDIARYAVMPHYHPYIDYKIMLDLGLFKEGGKTPIRSIWRSRSASASSRRIGNLRKCTA